MSARDANARAKGVSAPRVAPPTKEAIAKFKEVKLRRDEARKKGTPRKGGGAAAAAAAAAAPTGVAAPTATVDDFFSGLVELSNISMVGVPTEDNIPPPSNRSSSPCWSLAPDAWFCVLGVDCACFVWYVTPTAERRVWQTVCACFVWYVTPTAERRVWQTVW
jgi:hypothetical protein